MLIKNFCAYTGLLKRGHSQTYHHVDVGLAGICTVIACECEACQYYGGLGACPLEKLHSLRLNVRVFLVIDHPLMLLWTQ